MRSHNTLPRMVKINMTDNIFFIGVHVEELEFSYIASGSIKMVQLLWKSLEFFFFFLNKVKHLMHTTQLFHS